MLSRKKMRKRQRLEKKIRKANHFTRFKNSLHDQSTEKEKISRKESKRTRNRDQVEIEKDQKNIIKLEKDLGISKKRKKLSASFVKDGLDYILDFNVVDDTSETSSVEERDGNYKRDAISDTSDEEEDIISKPVSNKKVRFSLPHLECSNETTSEEDEGDIPELSSNKKKFTFNSSSSISKTVVERDLDKVVRGLINRLNDSNLQSINKELEDLYRENSHYTMNEVFSNIILQSGIQPVLISDKFAMTLVMLAALLHNGVGPEVGSSVTNCLTKKLHEYFSCPPEYSKGKECDCVILLLCHMCNFKIIHCVLIYDIIRKLLASFTERDLELLILILKSTYTNGKLYHSEGIFTGCGMEIRRNDSIALKEIIQEINMKASNVESTSRLRYMLVVVNAIKTNNIRKIPAYDPSLLEHMKKVLKGLKQGCLSDNSQLRLSYNELTQSGSKSQTVSSNNSRLVSNTVENTLLLELAKKQQMNTDIRRTIFTVIMSSEDFIDAFEKLVGLHLSNVQEREIIFVAVTCCVQEKVFNPFYAYLCQKLLEFKRDHQITLQYCIWDHLKTLTTLTQFQAHNLQQLLVHLIRHHSLSVSVLRIVEFATLGEVEICFYQKLLHFVLSGLSPHQCKNLMGNIGSDTKKDLFLFIKTHVLTEDSELWLVFDVLLDDNVIT